MNSNKYFGRIEGGLTRLPSAACLPNIMPRLFSGMTRFSLKLRPSLVGVPHNPHMLLGTPKVFEQPFLKFAQRDVGPVNVLAPVMLRDGQPASSPPVPPVSPVVHAESTPCK